MTPEKREEIQEIFNSCGKIEKFVQRIAYSDAVDVIRELQSIRDMVGEALPGGYYGTCISCEHIIGCDEARECCDETICEKCCREIEQGQPDIQGKAGEART